MYEVSKYAPTFENRETSTFYVRVGNTNYEVTTHFNPAGKENILQQFEDLILKKDLL